jgi:hypothetical protein
MTLTDTFSDACGLFEFDIAGPLFEQMCLDLDRLSPLPLDEANLSDVAKKPGVYALHHAGQLVYVGKADRNARGRLRKHRKQLHGRIGIGPDDISFRCLHFAHTWDPFQPEAALIDRYHPVWNRTGFGPNDPGRKRDHTDLKANHWHVLYPLDPSYVCDGVPSGDYDVLELLRAVSKDAPFWVRFQGNRVGRGDEGRASYEAAHRDFATARPVLVPRDGMSVRDLLLLAIQALSSPEEWQLTQLPSHLLAYREKDVTYPRMTRLWPVAS